MTFRTVATTLMVTAVFAFSTTTTADAQRRGGGLVMGLAAGAVLGALVAGAASRSARAAPRYSARPARRTATRTTRSAQPVRGPGESSGARAIPASSGADPFAGVSASRRVAE